ncbi:mite allergen Der p 3-like [Bacillus rossius redtenbacheri]|uniref:mite allergen Der p 3-like n=1 Tax=Bacillus rossius redtenbacheri TaxID=93214 RepID=UPI002FDDE1C5
MMLLSTGLCLLLLQSVLAEHSSTFKWPYNTSLLKVIGGRHVQYRELPFMLSLEMEDYGHFCGASAIGEYWGLTAAHCAMSSDMHVIVRAGSLTAQRGGTVHHVERFITHNNFNMRFNFENDIALIKLKEPFSINRYVQHISLAMQAEPVHEGERFNVSGWGFTVPGDFESSSSELKEAEVVVLEPKECQKNPNVGGQILITENMICAQQKEHSAYKGDSGGPLFRELGDGRWKQVGIVSWGDSSGMQAHPAVFTRVSSYRLWIFLKTGI